MIVFGTRGDKVLMEHSSARQCPVCERERPFSIWLQYEYDHVWYVFGYLRWRKYFLLCDICNRGQKLDRREYEQTIGKVPIPFMRRYGCLLLPLLPVLLLGVGVLVAAIKSLTHK
jgi:hypothetical protein